MSEPNACSALTDLKTTAVANGRSLRLNGTKRWCSGATHSDMYLVYCRLSDEAGANGIGAIVVEKGAKGFTFGKREHHMGFRNSQCRYVFRRCGNINGEYCGPRWRL